MKQISGKRFGGLFYLMAVLVCLWLILMYFPSLEFRGILLGVFMASLLLTSLFWDIPRWFKRK